MTSHEPRFAAVRLNDKRAYLFACASTVAALVIRLALSDTLGDQPALVIFAIPIMISAYMGALRGGLAATVAAYLVASYLLLPPTLDFRLGSKHETEEAVVLLVGGIIIAGAGETFHRARRRSNAVIDQKRLGEEALLRSEERYEALVDWSPEPLLIQRQGKILFVNPAAAAMFGATSPDALVGRHVSEFLHPDSFPIARQRMKDSEADGRPLPMVEMVALRVDGAPFGVEVHSRSIEVGGERSQLTSLRDISVRQAHEAEIERLNRLYSALSEISQAIVRMPAREALFAGVCRTLVDHGGVRAAWIDWDVDGTRQVAAVAGEESARPDLEEATACHEPSLTAFREGRTVLHSDARLVSHPRGWKTLIEGAKVPECAAFPIREGASVRGILTVAAQETGFFQAKEIALLEEISRDISFALDIGLKEGRRNEADVALIVERDRFRSLFDYAPVGIIIADATGRYLDVNTTMQKMVGYSRADLIGQDASLIVAPEELPNIPDAVKAIHASDDYRCEWRFRRQDGSEFQADVSSIEMPDGNLLATVRDVTERDEATEAVRAAEERMRFALESANVGIWDMDYTTGALAWSEMLEAQYGLERHTFGGTLGDFIDRVHPGDRSTVVSTIEKAAASGLDFTIQHRALWTDGTVRFLRGAGRIVIDDEGRPVRGIGVSMDDTSQRSLEEQFRQSQKMEAVGRLAGGVAHDFNNLLTVILGYSELVALDLGPGARQAEDVAEVIRAGRSAAELTRQLLAFSRKQAIEPKAIDLSASMKEVVVMLQRLLGDNIRIKLALDPNLGIIIADHAQIEQLIINLAVNARDAMPAGGTLTIATTNVSLDDEYATMHLGVLPGSYARLTVGDTGCGMSVEVQAKLFEPFFTTKEVGKGTGLGLATVHGIVARSGGSITVQSTPDCGTTFQVFFPIVEGAEVALTSLTQSPEPLVSRRTVLIVDDSRSLRELTRRLAERLGYSVLVAENANMALDIVAAHPEIDIVLTDVVMPGWSGLELSHRILAQRPQIRIVLMSGYADEVLVRHDALNCEIPLLDKPFTSETLAQKLREVMESAPADALAAR